MASEFDLSVDWLADAPLTNDQRRAWNALRGELASALSLNRELQHKINKLEIDEADAAPTVLNRPEFNREVARMLAFDERYGGMSSVLYFDFEKLNETASKFGKAVADAVAREISNVFTRTVRSSDIIGRLAPDEYGVLLMRCDNTVAWRKAEALAAELQKALTNVKGCPVEIKVSYGAYTFRDNENLATGLKEAAQTMTNSGKPA